jgi:hypothetical protein
LDRTLLAESILGLLLMQFNSLIVQFSNQPSLNLKKGMNYKTVLRVLQEMKGLARALMAESILGLILLQFNSLIVQFSN